MALTTESVRTPPGLKSVRAYLGFPITSPEQRPSATRMPGYTTMMFPIETTIYDATPIMRDISLDREGFAVVEHKLPFADEGGDPEAFCDKYMAHMIPFIRDHFKASRVIGLPKGAIIRSPSVPKGAPGDGVLPVASHVHSDFAPISGPMMAALSCQQQNIPIESYSRLMIVQTWAVLSPPPQDFPLAFCDASTMAPADTFLDDFEVPGIKHKALMLNYNPSQRWLHFPNLTPDQIILFKGYDSNDARPVTPAHVSFDNRPAYPDAHRRKSIEARFFIYFD